MRKVRVVVPAWMPPAEWVRAEEWVEAMVAEEEWAAAVAGTAAKAKVVVMLLQSFPPHSM